MSDAYASTLHISFDVRGGLLMRQMHHWAAMIFIAAMMIHLLRVFFTGAFRKPRELNWVVGSLLLLLGTLEGFTGYSLPDDLLSGTGIRAADGFVKSQPIVGTYMSFFLFGGEFPGDKIIPRLFTVHVLLIPGILLALVILYAVGPSVTLLVVVLSINGWMVYARITRGIVLSTRERPYVEAAELAGCKSRRVIFRHILPNLASPLLTLAVLEFARMVIAEAALSFLGLGTQPPAVSWGLMIAEGRDYISSAWWVITFPGIALSLTVLGANLFASWMRITADPLQRERRFARAAMDPSAVAR